MDELIAEFRGVQDCDDRFNQLVLIAKKYSPSMELFIARHMPDPYVVIGDKLEAAVFGNIKQVCWNELSKLDYLEFQQ